MPILSSQPKLPTGASSQALIFHEGNSANLNNINDILMWCDNKVLSNNEMDICY